VSCQKDNRPAEALRTKPIMDFDSGRFPGSKINVKNGETTRQRFLLLFLDGT
jgi:hypothetical protein